MRKFIRIIAVVVACLASCLAVGTAASASASATRVPGAAGALCSTSQTIDITSLLFQPPTVAPGASSQAIATLVNCTAQQQKASVEWLGRFEGATTGLPPGCPAIDPLVLGVNLGPHSTATDTVGYLVPGSCTATALMVTVKVLQNGTVIAQRSAQLEIIQPTATPARAS